MGLRALLERSKSSFARRPPASTVNNGHAAIEHDINTIPTSTTAEPIDDCASKPSNTTPVVTSTPIITPQSTTTAAPVAPVAPVEPVASPPVVTAPPPVPATSPHTRPSHVRHGFRMSQLVGDNPPMGSCARVVRRKYQSIVREREKEYKDDDREVDAVVLYEVEFPKNPSNCCLSSTANEKEQQLPLGIELETDFYGNHAVVKEIKRGSLAYSLSKVIRPGHMVVAVNGKNLSKLTFNQILYELKHAASPRVIRFLDPNVMELKYLQHEPVLVNRDQYGFAKDDRYILKYRKQLRKRKHASYQNERAWADFVQRHHGLDALDDMLHSTTPEHELERQQAWKDLRELVLCGIPVVLRPRIWSVLTHVSPYKAAYPATYYEDLIKRCESSPSLVDIEKDIFRTYPEHLFFQSESGKLELKHVLCAYSLHNPVIGYCQSMNFIAGMMLLFMREEDAFWLLSTMIGAPYLPAENYTQSMVGTQTDQLVFKWLVSVECPAISARLEACGIQIQLITLHWFLCAFVCTLPTEAALRIWDWFFLDGEQVLFTVAIGILKMAEERILGATTHSDLHTIVRELGTDLHDEDQLMAFLMNMTRPPAHDEESEDNEEADPQEENKSPVEDQQQQLLLHEFDDDDEQDEDDEEEEEEDDEADPQDNGSDTVTSPSELPVVAASMEKQPHKQTKKKKKKRFGLKRLGQRLLAALDKRNKEASYVTQFTIHDIERMRSEFRQQIEATAKKPRA